VDYESDRQAYGQTDIRVANANGYKQLSVEGQWREISAGRQISNLTMRVRVAAPGNAILSTPPAVWRPKCGGQDCSPPQQGGFGLPGGHFHSWFGRMFRAVQIARQ